MGSCKLWQDIDVPIVIVKDSDKKYRALYNTCQHRGGPIVTEEYSTQKRLRCGYHGWTYNYDGDLIGVPDQRDFVDLDMPCNNLTELRCECWGNWIFVNRDDNAEPLTEFLKPIMPEFEQFDLEHLQFYAKDSIPIEANWKACLDAFMETYHLKHIHPETVNAVLDHKGTVITLLENGHNKMYTPNREGYIGPLEGFADISSVGELPRMTNLAYGVFPNFVMPLDAGGFPLLIFWPVDKRNTRLDVLWFAPKDEAIEKTAQLWKHWQEQLPAHWLEKLAIFNQVLAEDTQFLPWQQKAMETGAITGMPLSYLEQRIYHRNEAFDRKIGVENIPAEMRVQPVLGPLVEKD